jgi:ADP-ribosyl-[dinitrogen reductase] hydrolase
MYDGTVDCEKRGERIRQALWGLFIGDALSMPAHWFYSLNNIKKAFDGGIRGFSPPPHPHPESFMVGMDYGPDVETARRLGRKYDILHEHARFYRTSYSQLILETPDQEGEHGHAVPRLEDRFHYHHGLQAGENTLGAQLVRVLMRSVIENRGYDPDRFIEGFIEHLTTPGMNRDPYTEIYIRRWFEKYSRGFHVYDCAEHQRRAWSIGAHGGMIRPLVLSLLVKSGYQGLGVAIEHQNISHRSENVASALGIIVPLIHAILQGADPIRAVASHARAVRIPRVTGEELFAAYRGHHGPENIPKDEMWRLHTELRDIPFDVERLAREHSDEEVVRTMFATACYPEHGLPLLLYLAVKHGFDFEDALLANANAGGDNVHRGMILGLILGAACERIPEHLVEGLMACQELRAEIDAFTDIAVDGNAI